MIAVDTNVLVRFVTNDHPEQGQRSRLLLRRAESVYISRTVLLETEWVLRGAYKFDRRTILAALEGVLGIPTVVVEDELPVARAMDLYLQGFDFADALHIASLPQDAEFVTFDRKLSRSAGKIKGLKVTGL